MSADKIVLFLILAVVSSYKIIYGINFWKEKENDLSLLWKSKKFYGFAILGFFVWLLLWFAGKRSWRVIRIADLYYTYAILALVDSKRRIVPEEILAAYFIGQMLLGITGMPIRSVLSVLLSGILFTGILIAVTRIVSGKMGMGDVKLLGVTAMTAGWQYTLQVLMWGMGISFFYGMGLLCIAKKTIKEEFPFVPFLAAGIGLQIMI